MGIPLQTLFFYIKVGFRGGGGGVYIFLMGKEEIYYPVSLEKASHPGQFSKNFLTL